MVIAAGITFCTAAEPRYGRAMCLRKFLATLTILSGPALTAAAGIGVRQVATGFERPVWAGMPNKIDGKLWVMEQAGRVWIVDLASGERFKQPFLDIASDVSRKGNEEGLMGLAFDPDFQVNGRYYVNFTDKEHFTRIVRFTSNNHATTELSTAEVVLRFKQPFENRNGGWLGFGPDGMLYIGKGAGANYGWRLREGAVATPQPGVGGDAPAGAIEPVYVYPHGVGPEAGLSVTGGYVYCGPIAELQGRYIFGDYQNPRIWSFMLKDGKAADFKDHTDALQPGSGRIALIASFAEDNQGNLYIIDHSGSVYRIDAG